MSKNRGFLKLLVIVIIGILILAYFRVDVRGFIDSSRGQEMISYVKDTSLFLWERFLRTPVLYLYNDVFLDVIVPTVRSFFEQNSMSVAG